MRKPGRPPYVSRREEAKEGKDYRDVINTAVCVFLDLFYKTTEPCLWKRRQLDNLVDILIHFSQLLDFPQQAFLHFKNSSPPKKICLRLCTHSQVVLIFFSCVECKGRYFGKHLFFSLLKTWQWKSVGFDVVRPLLAFIVFSVPQKNRKGLEWHEGFLAILSLQSNRNPHSCFSSLHKWQSWVETFFRLHHGCVNWPLSKERFLAALLQSSLERVRDTLRAHITTAVETWERERDFLRPIRPVLVHPAILLFIDSHPFVISEGLPDPFVPFQPTFFWLCCSRLGGPARSLLFGSGWSFIFPPSRN